MPKIIDRIKAFQKDNADKKFFSFEYFPPKTEAGVRNLQTRLDKMCSINPLWIDVTWGAGGSTCDTTLEICESALECCGVDVLMHLTCTNTTTESLRVVLERCKEKGLCNILALRGDPPKDQENWVATEGGFNNASDLVKFIRAEFGDYFCIGVAAYPEGHIENDDREQDTQYFVDKVNAGADFAITQLFYDNKTYLDYCKKVQGMGVPKDFCIFPGIMPIQSYGGFTRMTEFCKTFVPQEIKDALEPIQNDDVAVKEYGIELGVKMARELLLGGCPGIHIYTLNLETSAMSIVRELGLVDDSKASRGKPWKGSNVRNRQKEDVRPIFWAQRGRSYIERTRAWDDFPNGRFGSIESPAYGEFQYSGWSGVSAKEKEARKEQWQFEGVAGLSKTFVDFLKGENNVKTLPWCPERPGDETTCLRKQLIKLCNAGYLTVNSQPRVNGAISTDPLFGWGPPRGVVYQKAYVEFFCSPEGLDKIAKGFTKEKYPEVTYIAVSKDGTVKSNEDVDELAITAVTWGVFPGQEVQQPTVVDFHSFMAWKDEAFTLWNDWYEAMPTGDANRELLNNVRDTWYLVNIVDNNFLCGDLFVNMGEMVTGLAK